MSAVLLSVPHATHPSVRMQVWRHAMKLSSIMGKNTLLMESLCFYHKVIWTNVNTNVSLVSLFTYFRMQSEARMSSDINARGRIHVRKSLTLKLFFLRIRSICLKSIGKSNKFVYIQEITFTFARTPLSQGVSMAHFPSSSSRALQSSSCATAFDSGWPRKYLTQPVSNHL